MRLHYLCASDFISANRMQEIASVYKEIIILKNDYFLTAGRISDEYFFPEEYFLRSYTFM